MGHFKKALLGAAFGVVATAGIAHQADAYTITTGVALMPFDFGTSAGTGFVSNATTIVNGVTFTFNNPSTNGTPSGIYAGSRATTATSNGFTSPFGAGSLKNYLAVEPGTATSNSITIAFATAQTSFALLWGTIDTYNNLTFSTASGDTITGANVLAAMPSGTTGAQTTGVLISGLSAFTTITAYDTTFSAFEFDPGTPTAVPEPASLALLGAGLVGVGVIRRRRQAT